jgi:hypothetical protein
MDNNSFSKKVVAGMLALVMVFGAFGVGGIRVAQAETNGNSDSTAQMQELHTLLRQLIALLMEQIQLLREAQGQVVDDNSDDDSTNDDSDDDDSSCTDDSSDDVGLSEAEATIYSNETLVKIELNGTKSVFSTDSEDRDDIIDDILGRYNGITEALVDAELTIEEEDRASRRSDEDWANNDDSSCDDEDSDDDDDDEDEGDDDDDDNSGHGNGDDDDGDDD